MILTGMEWILWDTHVNFLELSAAPLTPPTNQLKLYAKDSGGVSGLFMLNEAGTETELGKLLARKNSGSNVGPRGRFNFIEGTNITLTVADDSANNEVDITINSSGGSGTVTGTGVANRLAYWDGTSSINDDSALLWDTTDKKITIQSANNALRGFLSEHYAGDTNGGLFAGRKARGDSTTPTQALADDLLVELAGVGYHSGSNFGGTVASMRFFAAENFTPTAQGTYMAWLTTPTGSTTRVERLRLLASGHPRWLELTTNPGTGDLSSLAAFAGPYMKNDKLVFAYNNGGTVTYISIPMDGSTTTWTHNTTAP